MTNKNNQNNCNHSHEHIHSDPNETPTVFSTSISVEFESEITVKELISCLVNWFNSIKQWSSENHYLIGHIKSYIEDANIKDNKNFNLWISTTGRDVNIKNVESGNEKIKSITISFTAIIFGPDIETLDGTTLDSLQKNLQVCKISKIT